MTQEKEMSFLAHLEELRWHLVRSIVAIFVIAIFLFSIQEYVYDTFLLAHIDPDFITYRLFCDFFSFFGVESNFCALDYPNTLQVLKPTEQLMNSIWSCFILGVITSFPYILWEFWRFISPGLHTNEINKSKGFIFSASFLFFIGILFSFFIIAPISVNFLYNYQISDKLVNQFTMESHIGLITNMLLGVSLMFELPVIVYFLTKIGIISPEFLKRYRKHALVIVLILAAIITPPDVASQVIVAIPVLFLYEISIKVSKIVIKRQQKNASE